MAECGYGLETLNTLRKFGSMYQGHPDVRFLPALEASTGSLGEGLSLAMGMALAARLTGPRARTDAGRRRNPGRPDLGSGDVRRGFTSWITWSLSWTTTTSSSTGSSRTSWS